MIVAGSIIGLLSVGIWLYLLFAHGRFWQSGPVLANRAYHGHAKVAVVIPARDEAEQIVPVLQSLLAQQFGGELSIVLVDDNSTDGTGDLARSLNDSRLEVVSGLPLRAGWSGKMWAVSQGLLRPQAQAADYVLLTDADIVHAPGHLAQLVAKAEADGLDLVSEMVRLNCTTWPERALIPAFVFFFQSLYPFKWVADSARVMAGAAGGTMLVSQRALSAIEGVNRIRGALIDDCALAAEIKPIGSIWLGHAEQARQPPHLCRTRRNLADDRPHRLCAAAPLATGVAGRLPGDGHYLPGAAGTAVLWLGPGLAGWPRLANDGLQLPADLTPLSPQRVVGLCPAIDRSLLYGSDYCFCRGALPGAGRRMENPGL